MLVPLPGLKLPLKQLLLPYMGLDPFPTDGTFLKLVSPPAATSVLGNPSVP
jgi:hypothetical protein